MFKLPVCPHCHTIYRYGEVGKNMNLKIQTCYGCKKRFKASFSGIWILILIAAAAGISVNVLEIFSFSGMNGITMFMTNVTVMIVALLFSPFFVKYKPVGDDGKIKKIILSDNKTSRKKSGGKKNK